ncbi:Uncharacterized protein HZ326_29290, partial [Fusarium oxysporum f. sp. albedinis]
MRGFGHEQGLFGAGDVIESDVCQMSEVRCDCSGCSSVFVLCRSASRLKGARIASPVAHRQLRDQELGRLRGRNNLRKSLGNFRIETSTDKAEHWGETVGTQSRNRGSHSPREPRIKDAGNFWGQLVIVVHDGEVGHHGSTLIRQASAVRRTPLSGHSRLNDYNRQRSPIPYPHAIPGAVLVWYLTSNSFLPLAALVAMAQPTPSPRIPSLSFAKDEIHFSPQAPITPATPSPRSSIAGTKRKRPYGASMTPSRPPPEAIIDISSDSDSDSEPTPKAQRSQLPDQTERDDDGFLSISSLSDDEEDESPSQAKPRVQGISANPMDKPDTEPTLCKEQQDVVDLILRGRNVFYTGSAGCGKSTVLKAVVKKLEDMGKI